jgi:hypothetical protein
LVASSNRFVYISPFLLLLSSSPLLLLITHNVTVQSNLSLDISKESP